jgi:ABC-type polysaccharide/polyol phosphate transport system ATPase subunit
MGGAAVVLRDVSKYFVAAGRHRRPLYRELLGLARVNAPPVAALDRISLELPRGVSVALVGPNGAGKSTLMRTIAGIYRPSAGSVTVEGRVACYFEAGAGIAPTLPVLDNVFLYAAILGLGFGETRRSVDAILSFAELGDQSQTRVEQLSFGTQQRLFFAVLLQLMRLGKADVFLFDEWLGGVDMRFRDKAETALATARGEGASILYASHDLERLERMCELGIYLDGGRVRASGPTADVVRAYRKDAGGS